MPILVTFKRGPNSVLDYTAIGPNDVTVLSAWDTPGYTQFSNTDLSHYAIVSHYQSTVQFGASKECFLEVWLPLTDNKRYDPIFLPLSFYV